MDTGLPVGFCCVGTVVPSQGLPPWHGDPRQRNGQAHTNQQPGFTPYSAALWDPSSRAQEHSCPQQKKRAVRSNCGMFTSCCGDLFRQMRIKLGQRDGTGKGKCREEELNQFPGN